MFTYPVIYELKAQGTKTLMPRTETYIFRMCVWGKPCNRSKCVIRAEAARSELSGESNLI